jgi:predicted PurR-regulated permease PerM
VTLSGRPEHVAHASGRWATLRARLGTVSPEALGRVAVAIVAIGASAWLVAATWPALMPFLAGAVIAYAVLPIANALDRFMPRILASVLAELVALSIIVGVVILIVPPLVNGLSLVASRLPSPAVVDQRLAELQTQLGTLPEPMRTILTSVATDVIGNLQGALQGFVSGLAAFVSSQILGIFETASFLLGLLVVPVWVLTVVADERRIKQRGAAAVAPAIRADVYALFRIVDRTLGTFLRVQVLAAIAVGAFVWLGLTMAEGLRLIDVPYEVTAAVLLGVPQVIPQLGFLLGFVPILLVLAVSGPQAFLVVLVVYVIANRAAGTLVNTSVSRGVLDVHPALMIPGLVAIGQLGLIPLLAGAPIIVIARDTVRYLNGRLSEPANPANVLPGERGWNARGRGRTAAVVPSAYRTPAGAQAAAAFVPSVYRVPATPGVPAPQPVPAASERFALPDGPALLRPVSGTATSSMPPVTEWSTAP